MLRRATAALYCDLSAAEFEREVSTGRLPHPVRLGNHPHWDRGELDEALNRLVGKTRDWRSEQPGLAG
jgi:predicted DNA-binding transcriptional regulator AlpA